MTFQDHFSSVAGSYSRFRPGYPNELFEQLASLAPGRSVAWDCATGSGQAARQLASNFEHVVASDASESQLRAAPKHDRVSFVCCTAESSSLAAGSAELATVAQAAHWFDLDRFYNEVRRVVVPGGVVALWSYASTSIAPGIDEIVRRFQRDTLAGYWPAQRRLVDDHYRGLAFPFSELTLPPLFTEATMTLGEFAGYLRTWSAVQRYRRAMGKDPVEALTARLLPKWGSETTMRLVKWPLTLRVGRV